MISTVQSTYNDKRIAGANKRQKLLHEGDNATDANELLDEHVDGDIVGAMEVVVEDVVEDDADRAGDAEEEVRLCVRARSAL